jgi:hypothetical protein
MKVLTYKCDSFLSCQKAPELLIILSLLWCYIADIENDAAEADICYQASFASV